MLRIIFYKRFLTIIIEIKKNNELIQVKINMKEPQRKLNEITGILKKELPSLKDKYHIDFLGIFGSFLRGEQTKTSDLDILVSFNITPTLFQFIRLEQLLSRMLDVKVDLVMKDSLKPMIGKRILSEVKEL